MFEIAIALTDLMTNLTIREDMSLDYKDFQYFTYKSVKMKIRNYFAMKHESSFVVKKKIQLALWYVINRDYAKLMHLFQIN